MTIKKALTAMDESLLVEFFEVAQSALNDAKATQRVAKDLGVSLARVHAFANVAVAMSMTAGEGVEVFTVADLNQLETELREVTPATEVK